MADSTQSNGLISRTLAWIIHPTYSDADPVDWFAFAVLVIIASLLWVKVVRLTIEPLAKAV